MITLRLKKKKGLSLVEILLATVLITILILGVAGAMSYTVSSSRRSNESSYAAYLASEGVEALRNIRDQSFANLTDGTWGLALSSNQWTLSGSSDVTSGYTRQIIISSVDADTKRATVNITWGGQTYTQIIEFTRWQETRPVVAGNLGLLVYADNSGDDDVIRYRILDANGNWTSVRTVPDLVLASNPQLRSLRLYSNPKSNEKILIAKFFLYPSASIYGIVWDGNSWGNPQLITTYTSTANAEARNFDGDFISSGSFFLIYGNNTFWPQYRIWNGSTWSSQQTALSVGSLVGFPNWINAKARPGTNNIMVAVHDTSNHLSTIFWNGSSWGGLLEHTTNTTGAAYDSVDMVWSRSNSAVLLMTYTLSGSNNPVIRTWNGTAWSAPLNIVYIVAQPRASRLISSPVSDLNLFCYKDSSNNINCLSITTIPLWAAATNPIVIGYDTSAGNQRSFDMAFEDVSGELAVIKYNGGPLPNNINERKYSPGTNTWTPQSISPPYIGQQETVLARPRLGSNDIMFMYGTTDQKVYTEVWNGTNNAMYTTGGRAITQHGTFGSNDLDFWFDFAWDSVVASP